MANDWKWYAGASEEYLTEGPFDAKEEAISAGAYNIGESFYILEAYKESLLLSNFIAGADYQVEWAEDRATDDCLADPDGNHTLFDLTEQQTSDLEKCITRAVNEWQKAHNLTFTPWAFTEVRNEELITLPETVL